jgi:anti-anti-sigma factor
VSAEAATACVELKKIGPDCVLILRGAFQLDSVRALHAAALRSLECSSNLIVDCTAAEHLDGCALQVLLALKKTAERGGGSLRLEGVGQQVRNYLRWSGIAAHFTEKVPMEKPADPQQAGAFEQPS